MTDSSLQRAADLHEHVPPDWYHQSINRNLLQRFWHTRRFRTIAPLMEPGKRILDIGCADGVFTKVILDASGAEEVIGIDVLEGSIAWAREHWSREPRMQFRLGDSHSLDFPDASFDAVTCFEMLEHVFDPKAVLNEMYRVLKPGGYVVLLVPSDNLLFRVIWWVWTRTRGKIWDETHIQSFRGDSLPKLTQACGFTLEVDKTFLLGMLHVVKGRKPTTAS